MHRIYKENLKQTTTDVSDLFWMSKQHPLRNTIRLNSQGQRCKFDGRQWRLLCQARDDFECRNLAFRLTLCQKHFYKIHLLKRPYVRSTSTSAISLKRSLLMKYEQQSNKRKNKPSLTRSEEKSLANKLIHQCPIDISFQIAEQTARHHVCEIIFDNYSQRISPENISNEWFYDFLLRNPSLPIYFHSWFASIPSTIPLTDHMIKIKSWQLGLVTRSISSHHLVDMSKQKRDGS